MMISPSSSSKIEEFDNLWCWVCFQSLLLGKLPPTSDDEVDEEESDETGTPSWTQEEIERLKTVLAMDEVDELLLGDNVPIITKGKQALARHSAFS